MLTKLRLKNFKNFKNAELILGGLTIVVGTNASGKSNLRDAFRFLHGIGRGYNLAEIIGQKWIEGGVLQWNGLRGGTKEITFQGTSIFSLEVEFKIPDEVREKLAVYYIEIDTNFLKNIPPQVVAEKLSIAGQGEYIFDSHPKRNPPIQDEANILKVRVKRANKNINLNLANHTPIIAQIAKHSKIESSIKNIVQQTLSVFKSMRFFDFHPNSMKMPSFPGQNILGDQGENLSSVLQNICTDDKRKNALIQWIEELTPMDASNFEFTPDQTGKILLTLVEKNGQKTSAYSASDGTLRFLGILAAFLGNKSESFYFFEEIENGIHPTRLSLLIDLIEGQINQGVMQMIVTTHAPLLLRFLSRKTLESVSLTYRLKNKLDAEIIRILDIPEAKNMIEEQGIGNLYESGWLENVLEFTQE